MELRPYQSNAVRELRARIAEHKRVVAVAPTGSGKTVIGSAYVAQHCKGMRVLWLAHRVELLHQARRALILAGVSETDIGVRCGELKENDGARVLLGSVHMDHSKYQYDLIVVDEAHHVAAKSYQRAIGDLPVLGLTATPERLDGTPMGETFIDLFVVSDIKTLADSGYIAAPDCYGLSDREAIAIVKGVTSGKDYIQTSLSLSMMNRVLIGNTVRECRRLASGEPTIVFAVDRKHGRRLAQRFEEDGRPTGYLDGETPQDERKRLISEFTKGDIEVIVNVNILGEGVDIPEVQCVALCRPTKSLAMYLQQVGRAFRPYKGRTPIVLDHAGNYNRFGDPLLERSWSLRGHASVKYVKTGSAKTKTCVKCARKNPTSAVSCSSCGAALSARESTLKELEEHEATLRLLSKKQKDSERLARRAIIKSNYSSRTLDVASRESGVATSILIDRLEKGMSLDEAKGLRYNATLTAAARKSGVSVAVLNRRLLQGIPLDEAMTMPETAN